ncbi:MAG: ABC transporter ATP-binding protein [Ferrovibrio sp.]|uniref:ABC transporter ATP-binding protein n=1 Tax=Ferrovibrio sp. TaxID=1917215 RepID=UPI002624A072|nr:ABC transporter ATP-binding protein [Ferrovibrio sp.]MCW0233996.1 ABC transporter ATP-binding protein [Ferrovibrio sp.]
MNAPPLLAVQGLTRRFGGLVAVDGLDLTVFKGEIIGLLGPNGSGKTTALNLISGALKPDAGTVALRGDFIQGLAPFRIARRGVARTFQLVRVLGSMTCRENVLAGLAFGTRNDWGVRADANADDLLQRVGLVGRGGVMTAELTYIDQKRLELARALALRPDLLLLDEWLAGLNPTELLQGIELVRSLRGDGIAILMVEHVMDAIRSLCDRCVVMNAGRRIAEGTPSAVLADPEVIRAYLGDEDA